MRTKQISNNSWFKFLKTFLVRKGGMRRQNTNEETTYSAVSVHFLLSLFISNVRWRQNREFLLMSESGKSSANKLK